MVRAAGLEPSRSAKHQADNPLKTNDNFSRYRPSRLVIPHNLRATRWSSQEDYLKESRYTQCKALLDTMDVKSYLPLMEIESIAHKGLRRFFETGNAKGLVGDINRLRKMLAFIDAAGSLEELSVPPNYGLHPLTGDRAGTWSMTVTKNWRLTFRVREDGALLDMTLEDYHGS
ncbi:type II toxin-antitoxin system RelE/ParE family toxin [Gluconobacter cerevisiae]